MIRLQRAAVPALILAAFTLHVRADTALSPVVVTATRQPQKVDDLLSDVTVLERADIEQSASSTLTEFLSLQPGIETTSNGGPGMTSDVRIRGTESKHVVVLVDGQRVSSATMGTISWSRIPLADVDHIEILRGPASALYGSDALGGVIQIFTRRGEGPAHVYADSSVGSYNTRSNEAGISGQHEGLRYHLGFSDFRTDGFSAIANPSAKGYNPDKDGYRLAGATGSLSYASSPDNEMGVSFMSNKGRNRYDNTYSAQKDYQNETDVGSVSSYWKRRIADRWQSTLSAGRSEDLATNYTNGAMSSIVRTHQEQYAWQNDLGLPVGDGMVALESLRQRISGTGTFTQRERSIDSLLGGWQGDFGAHSFQINGRHDLNSQFGSRNTGNLAYGFRLTPAWRLHGAYGTAFKAPTFNDLYFPYSAGNGVGNPALLPESSRNAEAGLRFDDGRQVASLIYFSNRIKNLIQWQETPPGSKFYTPFNVGEARIDGWTGDYQVKGDNWHLAANVNLQSPEDAATGKRLYRRARQFGALKAGVDRYDWTAGLEVQAMGKRWDDVANTKMLGGYALVNLYATRSLSKEWSLYGRIENLFNRKYELVLDFGVPGVSFTTGLRYQMK